MSTLAREWIERAFSRLAARPGFVERPDQRQLAHLLGDLIEGRSTGAFEAPTGLGKSLAALIPALAHAYASGKRTVIATYTNVLAEQYWRHDLPLARSLFEGAEEEAEFEARSAFLIGRQRYACRNAMRDVSPDIRPPIAGVELGIETEFRQARLRPAKDFYPFWQSISVPPACASRLCPDYDDCYYYRSRRLAEKAEVIITNHSVVLQDAILRDADSDGVSLLGDYDFLILDEAHDFPQAALNALEFELSGPRLEVLQGIASRLERTLQPLADASGDTLVWAQLCETFRQAMAACRREVAAYAMVVGKPGILASAPDTVSTHPQVTAHTVRDNVPGARRLAEMVGDSTTAFVRATEGLLAKWRAEDVDGVRMATESVKGYRMYLAEFGAGANALFSPNGVSVSYVGRNGADAMLRLDVIGLAEPLKNLLWEKKPYACLSATLALDGAFDFFSRSTGAEPTFCEILPSPFDFRSQAALYLPPPGRIPDPTVARREGTEDGYHRAVARELSEIIETVGGRTLALFHSRREMEAVLLYMTLPPEYPIYVQGRTGAGSVGERFLRNVNASLFALRSFWTGFDAPGETLSCVALVRVPFEVPVDPPQIARLAWLQTQGLDAFGAHTLPLAKMLMRQGAGRLIRRADDRGVIALLDSRLRTKRYGDEILANLPEGMRAFDDIRDAVGAIGLEPSAERL